jgi:hypothetical protein
MNIKAIQILFFTMSAIALNAQSTSDDQKQIAGKVEELRSAMVTPNEIVLDKLLAPQLSYGHSGGKVEGKESLMRSLNSGESDFLDITISDLTVEVIGDVGIVRHKLSANTQDKGKERATVNISVLLVWYKLQGTWKLVARQAVKI